MKPAQTERRFLFDRRNVFDRGKRSFALAVIRNVGIEQRQIKLYVQRFFVQLTRQIHPRFGRIDVPIQVQHQVVRYDRVSGCEKRHESLHQVLFRRRHLAQVIYVGGEVYFLHRPGVFDRSTIAIKKIGIAHRTQCQTQSRIQQSVGPLRRTHHQGLGRTHWQASHASGFSREQDTALRSSCGLRASGCCNPTDGISPLLRSTVALAIRVAGRDRR